MHSNGSVVVVTDEVAAGQHKLDAVQLRCADPRVYGCSALATAVRSREQVVLAARAYRTQRSLGRVVVDLQMPIAGKRVNPAQPAMLRRPSRPKVDSVNTFSLPAGALTVQRLGNRRTWRPIC